MPRQDDEKFSNRLETAAKARAEMLAKVKARAEAAKAGGLVVEGRIPEATISELRARGHKVQKAGNWANGKVMAVRLDQKNGVLSGAVSPRGQIGYVSGD